MKIGLMVAIEMDAVMAHYKNVEELPAPRGFRLYRIRKAEHELYVLRSGIGEIGAAAGVQYLITACGIERLVNFGVVGGLSDEMALHRLCVVERVVHYKYDCSELLPVAVGQVDGHDSIYLPADPTLVALAESICPELMRVTCCSGDKFVATAEEKTSIRERFAGDVCDMESAGIVLTCELNGIPCLLLKAVSDGLAGGAKEFFEELFDASLVCLTVTDRVIDAIA